MLKIGIVGYICFTASLALYGAKESNKIWVERPANGFLWLRLGVVSEAQ